jgi:hypothetical protein
VYPARLAPGWTPLIRTPTPPSEESDAPPDVEQPRLMSNSTRLMSNSTA